MKIAVLIGSLRKESYNRRVANTLISLAPKPLELEIVEIGDLPLFNEDLEGSSQPAAWTKFQEKIRSVDGILFCSPEYNRSMPPAIKNAVDIGSRGLDGNVWTGKSAGVTTASLGAAGGTHSHHHLRLSLAAVGVAVLPQPEVCLGKVQDFFDPSGTMTNEKTKAFLVKFLTAYASFAEKLSAKR